MRILITGGAGFLGSHLCDRFLSEGHSVIAMDNLITGTVHNVEHLAGHERFRFIKQDVTEYLCVDGALDAVLHLASPASPVDYLEYPIQTLKVGALGTHKTLGLALSKRAKFLLASTSEVYGDPQVHPQPETYWGHVNPIGPRGVYDEAKRFAEALTMAYHRYHGLDTRIARIFNTYGPRMRLDDGRVVPNFIGQALRGEALTVYGDGSQTRSFCYCSDLIEGIYRLLQTSSHSSVAPQAENATGIERAHHSSTDHVYCEPVNLGNPIEMRIHDFALLINRLVGNTAGIVHKPLPVDDPKVRQPDITRARQMLGWEPQVGLEEGLRKTIEWFRGSA